MIKAIKDNFIPLLFLLVLSASLAGNVYLGRAVRSLRSKTQMPSSSLLEARIHQQLDSLKVKRIDGNYSILKLRGDRPKVIYIFSPGCTWCARNLKNIEALSAGANSQYEFIGISTSSDGLGDYVRKNNLTFPAYEGVSQADLEAIDFRGTPQTVVISRSGEVEHNWPGAYVNGTADIIQQYFSVQLPGVATGSRSLSAITLHTNSEH